MGNWRTVHVMGRCRTDEAERLRDHLRWNGQDFDGFGPLTITEGLCGLGEWPEVRINRVGNLAERDYSVEDVAEHLRELVNLAPSLVVRIDCGGDYETDECIATVIIGEDRTVAVLPPQVEKIPDIPEAQLQANLFNALARPPTT